MIGATPPHAFGFDTLVIAVLRRQIAVAQDDAIPSPRGHQGAGGGCSTEENQGAEIRNTVKSCQLLLCYKLIFWLQGPRKILLIREFSKSATEPSTTSIETELHVSMVRSMNAWGLAVRMGPAIPVARTCKHAMGISGLLNYPFRPSTSVTSN